jgi:hypothetical protein
MPLDGLRRARRVAAKMSSTNFQPARLVVCAARFRRRLLAPAVFFAVSVFACFAATPAGTKLVGTGSAAGDLFGSAVAISGNTAVVLSPFDNSGESFVYVFENQAGEWNERARFNPGGYIYAYDFPVAISGDRIAVGSVVAVGFNLRGSASVYVRDGTNWVRETKLDGGFNDDFGSNVALDGDTLVVGATGDDTAGNNAGALLIYTRSGTNWDFQQKLTASDAATFAGMGSHPGISGNTVVTGAPHATTDGNSYVFVRSNSVWTEERRFTNQGAAIAVSGDSLVLGNRRERFPTAMGGQARVFARSNSVWSEQQTLSPSDSSGDDYFGVAVAIDGDRIVVGANHDGESSDRSGRAYVFARSGATWTEQDQLAPSETPARRGFGHSVAVSGSNALVGTGDQDNPSVAGSAWLFGSGGNPAGTNNPPVFAWPVIPSANPGVVNRPVIFSTLATDPDKGNKVAYEWHFGDEPGVAGRNRFVKKFAAAGSYDVFVRATDGKGGTADSEKTRVEVVAAGTVYFDIAKAGAKLNFAKTGADVVTVSGQIPLADGTTLEGKVLVFEFGSLTQTFTLDARGKSGKGAIAASVTAPRNGVAKFSVKITGDFRAALAALGMTNATVKNVDATTKVTVTFDGAPYSEEYILIYGGTAGRTGTAK